MFETDARFETETEESRKKHAQHCGCRDCDPDFYFDPAELEAGRPDWGRSDRPGA